MKRIGPIALLAAPFAVALFALAGGGVGEAAWLGMTVESMDNATAVEMGVPANSGQVVVVRVEEPALNSGVIAGDALVGINGKRIHSVDDFLATARDVMNTRQASGQVSDVVLTLNRLGSPLTITVPSEWVEAYVRQ